MEDWGLVIPAYNEEKRIRGVLYTYINKMPQVKEFIVVCDGTDGTDEIVKDMRKIDGRIELLEYTQRLGKGGGVAKGLLAAHASRIGFVDCDLAVQPDQLIRMFRELDYYSAVIASRRTTGSKIAAQQPFIRRILSKGFNWVMVRLLFGLKIADTQCGAKVFHDKVVRFILPQMLSKGFDFDVELLWRIHRMGYTIREFPVVWEHQENSKFQLKYIVNMFFSLLWVRLHG